VADADAMSLAELFYGRQAVKRLGRWLPKRAKRAERRRQRVLFEPLEPRVLLDAAPLLPTLVSGVIGGPGEQDRYTFDLDSDTRLYFDSETADSNMRWSLVGPAGTHVSERPFTGSDSIDGAGLLGTLPAGAYTLTVNAS